MSRSKYTRRAHPPADDFHSTAIPTDVPSLRHQTPRHAPTSKERYDADDVRDFLAFAAHLKKRAELE